MQSTREKELVPEANQWDVFFGRGSGNYMHHGNTVYRGLVKARAREYANATLMEKERITMEVITAVHEKGGRFLRKPTIDESDDTKVLMSSWEVVDTKSVLRKIRQLFRDFNANRKPRSSANSSSVAKNKAKLEDPASMNSSIASPKGLVVTDQDYLVPRIEPSAFTAVESPSGHRDAVSSLLQDLFGTREGSGQRALMPALTVADDQLASLLSSHRSRAVQRQQDDMLLGRLERQRLLHRLSRQPQAPLTTATSPSTFETLLARRRLLGQEQPASRLSTLLSPSFSHPRIQEDLLLLTRLQAQEDLLLEQIRQRGLRSRPGL